MAESDRCSEKTRLLGDDFAVDKDAGSPNSGLSARPPIAPGVTSSVNTPARQSSSCGEAEVLPERQVCGSEAVIDNRRRRPYHYYQVPGTNRYKSDSGTDASDSEVANYNRFTYISRVMSTTRLHQQQRRPHTVNQHLVRGGDDGEQSGEILEPVPHFTIPSHLIPTEFFIPYIAQPKSGEQPSNSSIVTIFAIWNTMMGTSILSMPWLVEQSGLVASALVFILMTGVCLFTAYRVLTMHSCLRLASPYKDFQCILRDTLSVRWEYLGIFFSVLILSGAMLVYWVLMSNFLYNSVEYFHNVFEGKGGNSSSNISTNHGAFCTPSSNLSDVSFPDFVAKPNESSFDIVWKPWTAPLFLIIFLLPVLNVRSPTFFTKFTGLGTISVIYITIFVSIKASQFGLNVSFVKFEDNISISLFRSNFPVALGTLSLAMFIHNCVCCIMENNKYQENNVRDLFVAYILVFLTYSYIGFLFYLSWPFAKSCIRDNFLDNFVGTDLMSVVARVFLFFQMYTVFPLLGYMVRVQLMNAVYGDSFPGRGHVFSLNVVLVFICVCVTVFYPHIGQLLRFSGAICGMAWIFTFPCLVYLVGQYKQGRLKWFHATLHCGLILLGAVILILQFAVTPD